ncbi:ABC transporter ATP-binding protein [Photobacterium nomapromontoriensis]|uniref:ABC transporter ATP-binding protein n=1 Tax=Photobacterium nomapromontoriensis TaxID=2910237 RepID=UPI003D10DA6B
METLVQSHQLGKSYGRFRALMEVNLQLESGQVLGLLGHNGAGKSTLIKCLLGMHDYDGELSIFGLEPQKNRVNIVRDLAYISDAAVLPEWMTVKQIIKYSAGVHSGFNDERMAKFLSQTDIKQQTKISRLSKGMKVQLHLALIMSTDARILILDEPTLGLDLMFRETFYQQLMAWFQQGDRALIIASHEVDEIAHLLTDVLILKKGKPVFDGKIEKVQTRFSKVTIAPEQRKSAEATKPLYVQSGVNEMVGYYDNIDVTKLAALGKVSTPTLAEVFVALQQGA